MDVTMSLSKKEAARLQICSDGAAEQRIRGRVVVEALIYVDGERHC